MRYYPRKFGYKCPQIYDAINHLCFSARIRKVPEFENLPYV